MGRGECTRRMRTVNTHGEWFTITRMVSEHACGRRRSDVLAGMSLEFLCLPSIYPGAVCLGSVELGRRRLVTDIYLPDGGNPAASHPNWWLSGYRFVPPIDPPHVAPVVASVGLSTARGDPFSRGRNCGELIRGREARLVLAPCMGRGFVFFYQRSPTPARQTGGAWRLQLERPSGEIRRVWPPLAAGPRQKVFVAAAG